MGLFVPDHYFDTVYEVTPELLVARGIKGLILDIDNTLVPYEIPTPTEENVAWLKGMWDSGIKTAFVSNNHQDRVELYNKSIGCPAFYDSGKPLKKACRRALAALKLQPSEVAIIGDQVFTDVWAAHNAGIPAILVPPIRDKRDLLTRFKRVLERPVMRKYHKRKGIKK